MSKLGRRATGGRERETESGKPRPLRPLPTLHLPIDQSGANLFFQLISRRYEKGPLILISNQAFRSLGEVFGDRIITAAILDRVLHHAVTVNIRGNSYRLKDKLKSGLVQAASEAVS